MLRLPDSHPAAGVVGQLRGLGITCDSRGQTLRLSPGIMTTQTGLNRLSQALAAQLKGA
jgi:hypothetical protein